MQLTEQDILFLEQAQRVSKESGKIIVTTKSLLSTGLLKLFGVSKNAQGFWCFNVYVVFEPSFKVSGAEEWQLPEKQ
jgi:hypothetical protein